MTAVEPSNVVPDAAPDPELLSVSALVVVPPPPAGVAQVPSPLQKVDEDAPVPEFRFVTGRFPVTPVASDI